MLADMRFELSGCPYWRCFGWCFRCFSCNLCHNSMPFAHCWHSRCEMNVLSNRKKPRIRFHSSHHLNILLVIGKLSAYSKRHTFWQRPSLPLLLLPFARWHFWQMHDGPRYGELINAFVDLCDQMVGEDARSQLSCEAEGLRHIRLSELFQIRWKWRASFGKSLPSRFSFFIIRISAHCTLTPDRNNFAEKRLFSM